MAPLKLLLISRTKKKDGLERYLPDEKVISNLIESIKSSTNEVYGVGKSLKESFIKGWNSAKNFNNEIISIIQGPLSWFAGAGNVNSILSPNKRESSYATDIFLVPVLSIRLLILIKQSCNCVVLLIEHESIP